MTLTRSDIAHFTGSETLYRHSLMRRVLYTEGARHVAQEGQAYWLLDKIATLQLEPKIAHEPFQAWLLRVTNNTGTLTCTDGGKDGNDPATLYSEHIRYTDFPLDEIELWVEQDADHSVILLPTEH